ncbi:MAG TPA: ATPase [Marinilabiliales bacterium]|nr:ATPase [Marinilabiliales bacterium]
MIVRAFNQTVQNDFFKEKVIVIIGARQVGKTTAVRDLINAQGEVAKYLNGDEADLYPIFKKPTSTQLKSLIGEAKILVVDEAHQIPNIGKALKLIVETFPDIQIIATGSSSFDIGNRVNEPLTGRKFEYQMYALSANELVSHFGILEEKRMLEHRLIFGTYPEIVTHLGEEPRLLKNLVSSYLYRDVLQLDGLKKPSLLTALLSALAYQIGSEVSINELAQLTGSNSHTVEKYLDLLEKSFVIYKLRAFNRNLRNELKKSQKVYFLDNGVRNAILGNFNLVQQRTDVGPLWENYLMVERMKKQEYSGFYGKRFFWRTTQNQEIDLIEDIDGKLSAFEFKWNPKSKWDKIPRSFTNSYPDAYTEVITPENYLDFLI